MGGSASKLKNVKAENPITFWQIQGDLGSGIFRLSLSVLQLPLTASLQGLMERFISFDTDKQDRQQPLRLPPSPAMRNYKTSLSR